MLFRAASSAFRIASGMPLALPSPTPTEPLLSPTTTRIDQLAVFPPLWVLKTLFVCTTRTSSWGPSVFLLSRLPLRRLIILMLKLQPSVSGAVREARHAAMVSEAASIEHHLGDTGRLGSLRQRGADFLGSIFG